MLFGLALLLVAVNVTVVLMIDRFESRVGGGDIVVADRFMKAIELGSGLDPDGADRSGYEEAWDLLADDCRKGRAYSEFLAFFESRVTDHGFIQSWRRSPEESGGMGDRVLRYVVEYRDLEGRTTTIRFDLRVVEGDEGHAIVSYAARTLASESGR